MFEDKKCELKRAAEADDEMDRGRVKKVRYNNYNNKYYNGRHNNYNPFQVHFFTMIANKRFLFIVFHVFFIITYITGWSKSFKQMGQQKWIQKVLSL